MDSVKAIYLSDSNMPMQIKNATATFKRL